MITSICFHQYGYKKLFSSTATGLKLNGDAESYEHAEHRHDGCEAAGGSEPAWPRSPAPRCPAVGEGRGCHHQALGQPVCSSAGQVGVMFSYTQMGLLSSSH